MATIHDVALRAGVSTATVSRALNGKSTVDPALAARVLAAARELDYQPNSLARNLRRQETAVWALIISDIENPFFTAVARGVEDVAQSAGYSVLLCNSDEAPTKESEYLRVAVQDRVAGVILSPTSSGTEITTLAEHRIPVVAIDRVLSSGGADSVLVDSRTGARLAVAHLIEQGYERIACITGPHDVSTAQDRLDGYADALRVAGRPVEENLICYGDYKADSGRWATEHLLALTPRPDALFLANSQMAVGALNALRDGGVRVGRDVGVIAFDDAPWATLVDPPLSVVAQPPHEVGRVAATMLLDRVTGGSGQARTTALGTTLIIRGSSVRSSIPVT